MPRIGDKIIPRGRGWYNTASTVDDKYYDSTQSDYVGCPSIKLEGTVVASRYKVPKTITLSETLKAAQDIAADQVMILVRNVATTVLLPSQAVTWKSGWRGKRVDGHAISAGLVEIAGIVDPDWPIAGVPIGEMFWLIVKGPCLCRMSVVASELNTISVGDFVHGATAGASTGVTTGMTDGKLRMVTSTPTGVTGMSLARNIVGIAMSAASTAHTGQASTSLGLKLIDLTLY